MSMSRRTVALVVAVILAAVATVALISYISGERERVVAGGESVNVFVAKGPIASGTSAETASRRGLIEQRAIPRAVVPQGAIGNLAQIQGKVASVSILQDEVLVDSRWVAAGTARQGGIANLPRNRVAMSVEVAMTPGVSGFVQVGDRVSVMAQLAEPRGETTDNRVQFILQNLEVLEAGRRVLNEQGQVTTQQPSDKVILTLAVSPRQAERLAFAVFQGQIYFTLLPEGARSVDTPGRTIRNAFP